MANYQRFVSYLYEYQNNVKLKNCGFCRVELRDHNCRLEVHLKLPLYPFTPALKVYAFVPSNEKLYGIFLGNASYQQGNVSGTFLFSEKNIKESAYHFSQLGGIVIQTDTGFCFASAWKDLNINPEKFIFQQNKPLQKIVPTKETLHGLSFPTSAASPAPDKQNFESDQQDTQTVSSMSAEAENVSESTISQGKDTKCKVQEAEDFVSTEKDYQVSDNAGETCMSQTTEFQIPEDTQKSSLSPSTDTNNDTTLEKNSSQETLSETETISTLHTENTTTLPDSSEEKIISKPTPFPSNESEPALLAASTDSAYTKPRRNSDNFWETLLNSYPQCHPFFDDEIHNCVQLPSKDVHKIASVGCPICNNAFFRHNCQSSQHFLIGKKDCSPNNTCNEKAQYILAVPGIYNPREQYMATMFGFPYFKQGQNSRGCNHCWGYWYRIIPECWGDCTNR